MTYRPDGPEGLCGLVASHPCTEQPGNGDRREDADDGHDDEELDKREAVLFPHIVAASCHTGYREEALGESTSSGERVRPNCRICVLAMVTAIAVPVKFW